MVTLKMSTSDYGLITFVFLSNVDYWEKGIFKSLLHPYPTL